MTVEFYSIPQQITLVVASLISGIVSLLCSLIIIFIISRDRQKKLKCVYHRILLAVSVLDSITSLNYALGFLALPRGAFWGAQGNTASCEATGFLTLLLTSQFLYNFGIAVYYLMILRFGKSQKFVARNVEPYVHVVSLCLPIAFCFWALFADALNPSKYVGGWCYIFENPPGCSQDAANADCRGVLATTLNSIFSYGMTIPAFIGMVTIMIIIACHVHFRVKASSRYYAGLPQLDQMARQTLVQALLYCVAGLLPFIAFLIYTLVEDDPASKFIGSLGIKIFVPLQGLFNLIIYIRPRFLALRRQHAGTQSFLATLSAIIAGERRHTLDPAAAAADDDDDDDDDDIDDFAPELSLSANRHGESSQLSVINVQVYQDEVVLEGNEVTASNVSEVVKNGA